MRSAKTNQNKRPSVGSGAADEEVAAARKKPKTRGQRVEINDQTMCAYHQLPPQPPPPPPLPANAVVVATAHPPRVNWAWHDHYYEDASSECSPAVFHPRGELSRVFGSPAISEAGYVFLNEFKHTMATAEELADKVQTWIGSLTQAERSRMLQTFSSKQCTHACPHSIDESKVNEAIQRAMKLILDSKKKKK